jgi:glucose/arabinose dehydrogenase
LSLLIFAFALIGVLPPIASTAPAAISIEPLPPGVVIETVVPDANQVVAMDFTPDGRLLYTERVSDFVNGTYRGYVRVVVNGQLQPDPVYAFPVMSEAERGLLGIAVDPNFATNHHVWVYFTKYSIDPACSGVRNRVVRFTLNDDNTVSGDPALAACFPVNQPAPGIYVTIHNGGNLHFGPDGKLYVSVGNSDDKNDAVDPAQDLSSPLGKIHRYTATVPLSVPGDNPFPGNSSYAYGLRNSFDFDFDPVTGRVFATDNGDDSDDEINLVLPGYNYGWRPNYPPYPGDDGKPGGPDPRYNTIPPLIYWTPSIAPTGITFYRGDLIPEWKNDLVMCAYKDDTTALYHFKLNAARTAIVSASILSDTVNHQPIRCRTDVLTGPDGALYYAEGGGYYNGPIKRLSRTTSFVASTVTAWPMTPRAGGLLTHTIVVRHLGTLSNTFALTATLPLSTPLVAVGSGMTSDAGHVYWSGTATGRQSIGNSFTVRVTSTITTPYWLNTPIELTAPDLPPVFLTSTVIVNGYSIALPLIRR